MTRRESIGLLLVSAAALLTGCGLLRPSEELRYRLTVEVETPEGLKTGSSVIEVRGVKNPDWVTPEGRGTRSSFRGEAVAVDLPGGKTLFALLKTEGGASDAADFPYLAFADRLQDSKDWIESMRRLRGWTGEVRAMPAMESPIVGGNVSALPLLVTFGDIRNPITVTRVDPGALEKTFGAGVRLKRITVTVTDDAMTIGIEKRFSWWRQYRNRFFDGTSTVSQDLTSNRLDAALASGSFSTESDR
jgi:hypothetical protein